MVKQEKVAAVNWSGGVWFLKHLQITDAWLSSLAFEHKGNDYRVFCVYETQALVQWDLSTLYEYMCTLLVNILVNKY